ncbi:MBL fold metallo-hydrolase [Dehalococcoides mccartyi]|nr:MBL fold metallo-hydrolase [Dehalococcoides mccartyi]
MSNVFKGKYWSIDRFVSGFSNNAFLITCVRTGSSVIVDTPAEPHELITAAENTTVEAILITHGHQDHVEGYETVASKISAPTGIGANDRNSLVASAPVSINVQTGESINIGDISLKALFTPGHTPGSTCYVLESSDSLAAGEHSHVFTGDTLFPGGPGRSSSNEALRQIMSSLENNIFTLPDSTAVLPGHGEFTTIEESKREYAIFTSKPLDPNLSGDVAWT